MQQPNRPPQSGMFNFLPFPLFQAAINEAESNHQAPLGLVLATALASVSTACQGLVDVRTADGRVVPTSLMILLLAKSGERKSTVEGGFFCEYRTFQADQQANYEIAFQKYEEELHLWGLKRKIREKALQRSLAKDESVDDEEEKLRAHIRAKPIPPRKPKMLYEDTTSQAIFLGLSKDFRYAAMMSSEGSSILNGSAFNDVAKLNAIWSEEQITVDRVSSDSYVVNGARLTTFIMVQPGVLARYMENRGELARVSGVLARFVVVDAGSTQGGRPFTNGTKSWQHRDAYNARIRELLVENMESNMSDKPTRTVLQLSPEATMRWVDYFNFVEGNIAPGGRYADAGDHASKLPENAIRVAALLHHFEGFPGDISPQTIDAAIQICDTASLDFTQTFVSPPAQAQDVQDAMLLDSWLQNYRNAQYRHIEKNRVRQAGPNALRDKVRLNRAIELLCLWRKIAVLRVKKTLVLDLFPGMHG